MKTLDEVIEKCQENVDLVDRGWWEVDCFLSHEYMVDALHYLKELKEEREQKSQMIEDAHKAIEAEKERITKAVTYNPPLTWDELRQMEGKPVWVEEYDAIDSTRGWRCCRWMLVEFVNDSYMDARNSGGEQYNFDKGDETWQAYRKERG